MVFLAGVRAVVVIIAVRSKGRTRWHITERPSWSSLLMGVLVLVIVFVNVGCRRLDVM